MQYEKKFGPRLAPLLVEQCVDFIRERGLDEEGLFRMPGQANLVRELQEAFDCGDKPLLDRWVRGKIQHVRDLYDHHCFFSTKSFLSLSLAVTQMSTQWHRC